MMIGKDLGRDCELSTSGVDATGRAMTPYDATRAVLRHTDAAFTEHGSACWTRPSWDEPTSTATGWSSYGWGSGSTYSTDCLRYWAPNGQCYYCDLGHTEVCTAECRSPLDYAAQCLSTLVVAEAARQSAESAAADGSRYQLSASNADVEDPGISWGSHLSVRITTDLWENLCLDPRRPPVLGFVASAIAGMMPFFGSGLLLPMRDGTTVYSLSARAHQVTQLRTLATTQAFERGLLNTRREPHGRGAERLHLIGFDFNVISAALHCSLLQCCMAAAETGFGGLVLAAPVRALHAWSFGLDLDRGRLAGEALLADGRKVTLPAYVRMLAEQCLAMVEAGLITDEIAPGAAELLPIVVKLANDAEAGRFRECARHLDWAAKLLGLLQQSERHQLPLGHPRLRLFDHDFANTDQQRGALWRLWDGGHIDPLVTRAAVEACLDDGPASHRGWARGQLIRRFGDRITGVDWDHIELSRDGDRWGPRVRIDLPRPDWPGRAQLEPLLASAGDADQLATLLHDDGEGLAHDADPIDNVRGQLALADGTELSTH